MDTEIDNRFLAYRNTFIKKKEEECKNEGLMKLLDIMLSQDLNVGNNIDDILNSEYYKNLEGKYGKKS